VGAALLLERARVDRLLDEVEPVELARARTAADRRDQRDLVAVAENRLGAGVLAVDGERERQPRQRRRAFGERLPQPLHRGAVGNDQTENFGAERLAHGGEAANGHAYSRRSGHPAILLAPWPRAPLSA